MSSCWPNLLFLFDFYYFFLFFLPRVGCEDNNGLDIVICECV